MLALLSPSKTLDEAPIKPLKSASLPLFLSHSNLLINNLKSLSEKNVSALMGISPKLAALNSTRFKSFSTPFTPKNAKPAVLMFKGDVYAGLRADQFSAADLTFAQEHLRILSGLYGILRPLDLIQPYRLEMGTSLKNPKGNNLYKFWGDSITEALNNAKTSTIINLASEEYFKAVHPQKLTAPLITPVFKEKKGKEYKVIGLFAKKARGMMVRYLIENRLKNPQDLKCFNTDGYSFNAALSSQDRWVFTRG